MAKEKIDGSLSKEDLGPQPDFNDKKAFMAWMRAHIKNKKSTKPKKTNNFELDQAIERKGVRRYRRMSNEHIKCVVVSVKQAYPGKDKVKVYLVGFLTDSNRFSFETLRDNPFLNPNMQNPGLYRFRKMVEMFKTKHIDSDTIFLICIERFKKYEFFPIFLDFVSSVCDCVMHKADVPRILITLDNEFDIYSGNKPHKRTIKHFQSLDPHNLAERLNKAYDFIAQSDVCPWITGMELRRNHRLARRAKQGIMIAELAMLVAMIWSYKRLEKKLRKERNSGKRRKRAEQTEETKSLAEKEAESEEAD